MSQESLAKLLADLHAERVRTWNPAALKINIDQRATLVETADPAGWIKVGDRVPSFTLHDVEGDDLTLENLTAKGPAVLVFFRFAGCPACNIALPYYERRLQPALRALGVPLVAVSPQIPERLAEIRTRHELSFKVASDIGNALGHRFGILYTADEASQAAQRARGSWIGEIAGTGTWELPQPTVVVIGRDRLVKFADVSPDWLVRTEAAPVIAAVRALTSANDSSEQQMTG